MIRILVKFVGRPYHVANRRQVWLYFNNRDEVTLKELLNRLETEMGVGFNAGREGIIVLINGRNADHIGGLHANLKHLDEVIIASMAGAG